MNDVDELIRTSPSANVMLVENRVNDLFEAINSSFRILDLTDVLKVQNAIHYLNRVLEIDGERKNFS